MPKYVEDYLVGLEWDYDDSNARKFLNTQKQIEEQNKKTDKSLQDHQKQTSQPTSKRSSQGTSSNTQKQIQANATLGNSFKQLSRTWNAIQRGSPIGTFTESIKSIQMLQKMIQSFNKGIPLTSKPHISTPSINQSKGQAEKRQAPSPSAHQPSKKEAPLPSAPQYVYRKGHEAEANASPVVDTEQVKTADDMGKSLTNASKQATTLKNTISGLTQGGAAAAGGAGAAGGAEDAGAAGAGAAAAGGAAAAIIPVAGVLGIVAAIGLVTKSLYDTASSMSKINTDIETMSAKLWITNSAALQLNNTLSAMGKTTADLNDIALNPTLRTQFETLQQFQKSQLQLPSDFQKVNDEWAQSVTTPMEEIKETNSYMKELMSYDIEKALVGPFNDLAKLIQWIQSGLVDILKFFGGLSGNSGTDSSTASATQAESGSAKQALSGYNYNWASAMPSSSSVTSTTTNQSSFSTTSLSNSPTVVVNAASGSPTAIGQAAAAGVSSQNNLFLQKFLQGVNR